MTTSLRFRPDGWPLCPVCDEDELYSLASPATVATITGCYRCGAGGATRFHELRAAGGCCKDFGDRPGCLGASDPRFTMRFDDIGKPPIHFCAHCGPAAQAMNEAVMTAFRTRSPMFMEEFAAAISAAEAKQRSERS